MQIQAVTEIQVRKINWDYKGKQGDYSTQNNKMLKTNKSFLFTPK